ncbi:MAG: hypothetical protein PHN89_02755 [Candidatus Pacebacteria bacterium]|nr:hypothetical protein [Candidatus Paceibacterota bacterium]
MSKKVVIKVNSASGKFLADWSETASFERFSKEINGGFSECILALAVPFDYQGGELNHGNIVDIYISDKDTIADGMVKIYSGYISTIEPNTDGKKEWITVNLLGFYTKMGTDILKDSSQVVLYSDAANGLTTSILSLAAADIGLILRAIIDRYRDETVNPRISYTSASIPLVSQDAKYTIKLLTYKEAFEKICAALPSWYYWHVDENGLISVRQKPSTPTHTFEFSKHFKSVKINSSMEKIRNFVLVWNRDAIFNHYQNDASISEYGRRAQVIAENGIGDADTAENIANKFLAENKDPVITLVCEVIDNNFDAANGYDIESINPGDTCRFVGYDFSMMNFLYDNMLITKVDYMLDRAILTIELNRAGMINWQKKTETKVSELSSESCPETYS